MLGDILVRNMQENDLDEVYNIEKQIFSMPWSKESFNKALLDKNNLYKIIEVGGKIVGYCGMWTSFSDADLCNMAIMKDYRKNGLALKILTSALRELEEKGINHILLEVRESNQPAIELYRKMGFNVIAERKKYYSNPVEDAYIMEKNI